MACKCFDTSDSLRGTSLSNRLNKLTRPNVTSSKNGITSLLLAIATWSWAESPRADTIDDLINGGRVDNIILSSEVQHIATRLASHRMSPPGGGRSSKPLNASHCYSRFGPGRLGIQRALQAIIAAWGAPPRHLIIMGSYSTGSDSSISVVPTWHIPVPELSVFPTNRVLTVTTDDPYAYGTAEDEIPQFAVSRIPYSMESFQHNHLTEYVDKVIAYDNALNAPWKFRALHLLNDLDAEGNSGAVAAYHHDSLYQHAGPREAINFSLSVVRATQLPMGLFNSPFIPMLNQGTGFVFACGTSGNGLVYSGHTLFDVRVGNPNRVNSPAVEQCVGACQQNTIVRGDTIQLTDKTPVILALTCASNSIDHITRVDPDRLGGFPLEEGASATQNLLLKPRRGAVVVIGPSGGIHESIAYRFATEWFTEAWGAGSTAQTIEPAYVTWQAKKKLLELIPESRPEILSIQVMGDGALQMPVGSPYTVGVGPKDPDRVLGLEALLIKGQRNAVGLRMRAAQAGAYIVAIFDVQGRLIKRQPFVLSESGHWTDLEIRLDKVKAGIYFIQAIGQGATANMKVALR